jgi:nicotinate-nucleotide adenylyltransferase
MRIGIMGGTFDPVHIGHLLAAESARESAGLDEVWFMPTCVPPHKRSAPAADARHRLRMVELAIQGHPDFRACPLEIEKGGTSYTYETVRLLKERHPEDEFYYIIGADMVQYLPNWAKIEELAQQIRFIGLRRPGYEWNPGELPEWIARAVIPADMPQIGVSSTEIRRMLAQGRSLRYVLPEAVRLYVKEQGLYAS